jgi:hypothetical protein
VTRPSAEPTTQRSHVSPTSEVNLFVPRRRNAHAAAAFQQLTVAVISPHAISYSPSSIIAVGKRNHHCTSALVRPEPLKIFSQWLSLVWCGCQAQAQFKIAGSNSASISSQPPHLYSSLPPFSPFDTTPSNELSRALPSQ